MNTEVSQGNKVRKTENTFATGDQLCAGM